MEELIFELAKDLGRVGGGEELILRRLCPGAAGELKGRLKRGVEIEDCENAFLLAAAWLALAALAEAQEDGMEQMTAGDVTLRRSAVDRGERYRKQAQNIMRPYLADERFCFMGVRG